MNIENSNSMHSGIVEKPSASQLRQWRKLRLRKYRAQSGLFLAEGERGVNQILRNGHLSVDSILFSGQEPSVRLPEGINLYHLGDKEFHSITDTENPQGIAAVCKIPAEPSLNSLSARKGVLLATDAIQDPGNLGTMIRTAAWFGATGLLCGSGTVDLWNPKVVRSTAGATGLLPVCSGELDKLLNHFESTGWRVLLLDSGNEAVPLKQVEAGERTVLVVGNEANGIQSGLLHPERQRVRIEGSPNSVESLNAAVALGIALYKLHSSL